MARYIDADELTALIQKKLNENQEKKGTVGYFALETFTEMLQIMAAADVVPVVRCKDCTEWDEKEQECSHWYGFRENDFCSYGRRKDEISKATDS